MRWEKLCPRLAGGTAAAPELLIWDVEYANNLAIQSKFGVYCRSFGDWSKSFRILSPSQIACGGGDLGPSAIDLFPKPFWVLTEEL